jgi:integrase
MQRGQVKFDSTTYLQLHGKGRKERVVPLWAKTGRVLRNWFRECEVKATEVAFPSVRGTPLSSDGLNYILQQAVRRAADASCPSLLTKRVTPHLVRHYLTLPDYVLYWHASLVFTAKFAKRQRHSFTHFHQPHAGRKESTVKGILDNRVVLS